MRSLSYADGVHKIVAIVSMHYVSTRPLDCAGMQVPPRTQLTTIAMERAAWGTRSGHDFLPS